MQKYTRLLYTYLKFSKKGLLDFIKKKRIEILNQSKIIVYIKLKRVTLLLLINNNL